MTDKERDFIQKAAKAAALEVESRYVAKDFCNTRFKSLSRAVYALYGTLLLFAGLIVAEFLGRVDIDPALATPPAHTRTEESALTKSFAGEKSLDMHLMQVQ